MHDYYSVLGVSTSAKKQEIRSAYLRLVQKYHPDHNPSAAAAEFTLRLNEAYSVLSDDRKRTLYDSWLASQAKQEVNSQESAKPGHQTVPDIKCSKCGRQDASLRLSLMYYTMSFLVITQRRGASGIWCERCRAIEAVKWSLLTGIAGWWGFPWGPIYTIQALIVNALGGKQPRPENASVLRVLGYQLYSKGDHVRAASALRESLALEANADAQELFSFLRQHGSQPEQAWSIWKALVPLPSIFIAGICAIALWYVTSSPSGYETRYQPPTPFGNRTAPPRNEPTREAVNALVGELATIVETRAPIVGTHYEAQIRIQDHVLDRSKFEPSEVLGVASKIRLAMQNKPDPDGFMASALFNAEILGLSVDIVNGIDQGADVTTEIGDVTALQADPLISNWLENSRYWAPYSRLCLQLNKYKRQYRPGTSLAGLQEEYHQRKARLQAIKLKLDEFEAVGDAPSYNSLVREYNTEVVEANGDLRRLRGQSTMSQKLDLAFNKCLDSSILMSRFQRVDLASHEAEVASLPDPR